MKLIAPTTDYKEPFIAMIQAFKQEGVTGFWLKNQGSEFDYDVFIQTAQEQSEGKNLAGFVPNTTYWLIDNDELIGHTNIRHELNEKLLITSGHIGYHISPLHRRKGYGTKILALALEKAKALGIQRALVTCDEDNIGSAKVIEANGGQLENIIKDSATEPNLKRYWIDIE